MSRRTRADKREVAADPQFQSTTVTKFINSLMYDGKKSVAEGIFYDAIKIVEEKSGQAGLNVFTSAVNNAKPALEVKSRRVGGATYQVPVEVSHERQNSIALRWVVAAAAARKGTTMSEALAAEVVDAYNNTGNVVKKREETHKMAQANRAFAHLKW